MNYSGILLHMETFIIHCDGGARGNPGPAASGATVELKTDTETKLVAEVSEWLGETTNNVAEYKAVIFALEAVKKHATSLPVIVEAVLDSQLIVEQMNGNYKVRNEGLKPLYQQVRHLVTELGGAVSFRHVLRAENKQADRLVNKAIDAVLEKR